MRAIAARFQLTVVLVKEETMKHQKETAHVRRRVWVDVIRAPSPNGSPAVASTRGPMVISTLRFLTNSARGAVLTEALLREGNKP